jgi:hypothetical protein
MDTRNAIVLKVASTQDSPRASSEAVLLTVSPQETVGMLRLRALGIVDASHWVDVEDLLSQAVLGRVQEAYAAKVALGELSRRGLTIEALSKAWLLADLFERDSLRKRVQRALKRQLVQKSAQNDAGVTERLNAAKKQLNAANPEQSNAKQIAAIDALQSIPGLFE